MQLIEANCTEEVVLAAMALRIRKLDLTVAAVDDEEPLCVAQLGKSLLKNGSFNEIECLSEKSDLYLLVELELQLL